MSYARVPGMRGRGFAGYNDLPGPNPNQIPTLFKSAASSVADQSKQQAIAFAQQQLSNYPPASEVLAEYNMYAGYLKSIPGFNVSDLKDPNKVVALMEQALLAYAHANGVPTNTTEVAEYAASVAASEFGVTIPSSWPSNVKDLKSVAVDLAATAWTMETGIDPSMITVTFDALKDGKLTPDECEAIGGVAGAIAGAAICQAFGIPAPIGAFIGGLVGQDIGGTLGQIFGAGQSGAEEMESRINAQNSWAKATVAELNAICSSARATYWRTFDQLLLSTELQWELAEVNLGWKFNLRWFGIETYSKLGQSFSHAWDPSVQRFTGAQVTTNRATIIGQQGSSTTYYDAVQGKDVTTHDVVYTYGCTFDYGCPYPVVSGIALPQGLERDAEAFLARGAMWFPESARQYQCSYPVPSGVDLLDGPTKQNWINSMLADLQNEQNAVQALNIISVTVVGDLVKTAATVGAEKAIVDQLKQSASKLSANQLARGDALAQAKKTGQNLSDLLNYGTLALGAGLLLATLWKKRKS